jgi:hypothetical protein
MIRLAHQCAAILLLAGGLAACSTPEEIRQMDEASCASYGFQRGTTDFAACLQRETLARRYAPVTYGPDFMGYNGRPWWYVPPHR